MSARQIVSWGLAAAVLAGASGCRSSAPPPNRVSGYVEATDVRVAPQVGGRVLDVRIAEGDRVKAGDVIATIDTADVELVLRRAHAERDQANAQLRLLQAGSRPEDIRQAGAQAEAALADAKAAQAEAAAASKDLERFEALLRANAGSRKQRDDAATREDVAAAHVRSAEQRARAATDALGRLRAGARPQEIDAARAHLASVEAQIASLEKNVADAVLTTPVGGIVTSKLVDAGEMVAVGTPIAVITDLDHAWANVYVDEPIVPRLRLGSKATIITDSGQRLDGTITFISPKAEFTPRNVQTAEERAKLVYRLKVGADNRQGVLKPGMPVEAELSVSQ